MNRPSTIERGSKQLSRRRAIGLGGVALAGGAVASIAGPIGVADARAARSVVGLPKPIPGGVDAPPIGFIHWFLPGPDGSATPILGIPAGGFDVEPSTISDFRGTTAFAVVVGDVEASDGRDYLLEIDLRVMEGEYLDVNGDSFEAAFAFL